MNAVLYTKDLEPITVVDIPISLWEMLAAGSRIRLPVRLPLTLEHLRSPPMMRTVEIFGELFCRRGARSLMLFTNDEESALLLRASFLPGQNREVQSRERQAFVAGIVRALTDY